MSYGFICITFITYRLINIHSNIEVLYYIYKLIFKVRRKVFLKASKEIRRKPFNFLNSDNYLFEREFIRSYEDIVTIQYKKAFYLVLAS